ncbi:hypothetical protein RTH46_09715 [Pseudomonas sp. zfem004]|uniref:hypothetical protein n=1 Tax=Pseudomonas sp. zfem004 TaxID=3078199 RepID=UPI0029282D49|nr:hypothetical protein [Pseudomonas sp. zfem004]MDU9402769.1 hypothetical protein [Pseudomonas sp. zfem004]
MTKKDELKSLLAAKYDMQVEDILDTTMIIDIIGGKRDLAANLKEKFDVELSVSDLENASDVSDLAELL